MARKPAPHGTPSAYRRHLRHGEEPCEACRAAERDSQRERRARERARQQQTDAPLPDAPVFDAEFDDQDTSAGDPETGPEPSMLDRLKKNLAMVEFAMDHVVTSEPVRLATLSRRHSELLREIDAIEGAEEEKDTLDDLLGDDSNIIGFPTAQNRA